MLGYQGIGVSGYRVLGYKGIVVSCQGIIAY